MAAVARMAAAAEPMAVPAAALAITTIALFAPTPYQNQILGMMHSTAPYHSIQQVTIFRYLQTLFSFILQPIFAISTVAYNAQI